MPMKQLEIRARDGSTITAGYSADENMPIKGVVAISHGFGEHIGYYRELAQQLEQRGYANIVFDQRGHGKLGFADNVDSDESAALGKKQNEKLKSTDKKRKKMQGVIPSYQCFLDDLGDVAAAAKQMAPDVPTILYGHSMGGNIVLNYLLENQQSDYACAVLEAPWLGLYVNISPLITGIAKIIGGLSPRVAVINKLSPGDLTGDATKADRFVNDPLYHNRISMRMLAGVVSGCENAISNAQKIKTPIFIASAKNDRIVSNDAIALFIENVGSSVTAKQYDSRHAIRNDTQRETYYHDMLDYLDACVAEHSPL